MVGHVICPEDLSLQRVSWFGAEVCALPAHADSAHPSLEGGPLVHGCLSTVLQPQGADFHQTQTNQPRKGPRVSRCAPRGPTHQTLGGKG